MLIIFAINFNKKTCDLFMINECNKNSKQNAGPLSQAHYSHFFVIVKNLFSDIHFANDFL